MLRWTRRQWADVYLWTVILLGAGALTLLRPTGPREPFLLVTLVALFALAEYVPTRVRVGAVTFSFPMAYAAFVLFGPAGGAWTAAGGTLLANLARKRASRVTLFNATQFAMATLAAGLLADRLPRLSPVALLLYLALYYVVNNTIVDGLLWLRLRAYTYADWYTKTRYEALSAAVSLAYSLLMILLARQQREHDALSLLFFFLPLLTVGTFVRLLTNLSHFARHMTALMDVSTLAASAPASQALEMALARLDAFDEYCFAAVYQADSDMLVLRAERGAPVSHRSIAMGQGISGWAAAHATALFTGDAKGDGRNTIGEGAQEHALSMGAIPLVSGGHVIGVFTFGKERPQAIQPEDIRLLTTFANLVAAILRNLDLAHEREQLVLVQERNRLAREIHDGLAQSLAGAVLQMDRLERLIETDRGGALKRLGVLREQLRELLLEVRRSIYNLRPSPLQAQGLVAALRHEVQRLAENHPGLRLAVRGQERRLSALVEDEIYRIAQEGMTNALKHAAATEISVTLQFAADSLRLLVRDNGKGFVLAEAVRAAGERGRFGLTGMSERAERLGATFEVDSRRGGGTRLVVEVPLMGE